VRPTSEAALPSLIPNPQSLIHRSAGSSPALRPFAVKVRKYTDRNFDFDVSCPSSGWLLVTDRWASAWHAEVNEQPAKIWIGNLVFRAVTVGRGANHVSFSYHPAVLYGWLAASWTVLWAILAISIYSIFTQAIRTIRSADNPTTNFHNFAKHAIDSTPTQAIN
jgi:uncharacterized membrane protein YfhO